MQDYLWMRKPKCRICSRRKMCYAVNHEIELQNILKQLSGRHLVALHGRLKAHVAALGDAQSQEIPAASLLGPRSL